MMYYVCIENNTIVSILNYKPTVPSTVELVEITDDQYRKLQDQTHGFDIGSKDIVPLPQLELDRKQIEIENAEIREFLNSTDWMILRHIRQKTLGISTSLTEQQFLELEQKRNDFAAKIK